MGTLKSYLISGFLSDTTRKARARLSTVPQRWKGARPRIEFYYQADDPYSQLLAQVMPALADRYRAEIVQYQVGRPADNVMPERALAEAYACKDAAELAGLYELDWPVDLDSAGEAGSAEIARNERRRAKLGHYYGGMLYCAGEWFWGIDRLHFLEQRLREYCGQDAGTEESVLRVRPEPRLPSLQKGDSAGARELEYFYSFRSPYSYLSIPAVRALVARHRLQLKIRPVMPMVMRGLAVPLSKRLYIVRDCARIARHQGIPFGRIADPVGVGIERVIAIYPVAAAQDLGMEYLSSVGKGIWAEGRDVAKDAPLRLLVERAGLSWAEARRALDAPADGLQLAEKNAADLLAAGLWGVPSFRIGGYYTWGQDRLELLDRMLRAD